MPAGFDLRYKWTAVAFWPLKRVSFFCPVDDSISVSKAFRTSIFNKVGNIDQMARGQSRDEEADYSRTASTSASMLPLPM